MLRYSLGSLFLVLLYLGIGLGALVNATGIWPQVTVTLSIAVLVLFSLGAVLWNGRWRVFGIGFSATGWLYFLLVFSSLTNVRPFLLTESMINQLYMTMHGNQVGQSKVVWQTFTTVNGPASVQSMVYPVPAFPGPTAAVTSGSTSLVPVYRQPTAVSPGALSAAPPTVFVDMHTFANIGHALWAVIIGFIGGVTAQVLHSKSCKPCVESDEETSA